ncbi:TIR domain-containing protein [Rhodococcus baikonurensis]|uniref:TIR domain-containing protein n=1 Tax=Rhodococcus baikonurensis TaxID=172041 RepID=A0ABV5XM25_9NOCA
MTRRVFISYQHADQMKARGLNLMTYNKNVNVDFTGRHLLDPVKSNDANYITRKIKEQITGSSATIVLIGKNTADSTWVDNEIQWSKEKGNGIIGIRIDPEATIPDGLTEHGAEILDWYKPDDVNQFDAAIERAIAATSRGRQMPMNTPSTCGR